MSDQIRHTTHYRTLAVSPALEFRFFTITSDAGRSVRIQMFAGDDGKPKRPAGKPLCIFEPEIKAFAQALTLGASLLKPA